MPDNDTIQEQSFIDAKIEKASDGSFVAVASTNAVDRHGEIVDNNGWDMKAFKKNPVILWAHDHTEPAIGISKKTWVEGAGKKAKLMITPIFHDVTEKARAVKALVEMGVINSLSVGFKPIESPDGVTFTKNELLEVSIVNVPANSEAQMLAYKSLKSKGFDEDVIKDVGITSPEVLDTLSNLRDDFNRLESMVKALSVNPDKKQTEQRLSLLKVVAKASDKLLEADKKQVPVNQKQLVKVIKRATEMMTVAEKGKL